MTEWEALLLSITIEAPVAYGLVRWRGWPGRGAIHAAIAAGLATAATHPQLWALALHLYPRLGYLPGLAAGEALVVLAEAPMLAWGAGLSVRRALALSLATNAASAAVGLVLALSDVGRR